MSPDPSQPQAVAGAMDQVVLAYEGLYSWKTDHSMKNYIQKIEAARDAVIQKTDGVK